MQNQNYRLENIAWRIVALTLREGDYYQFQQDEPQGMVLDEGK
jgi:hypothetical protein